MFILLVSRGVPSDRDPQWGCFEKDQAEALASLGHKVVVVCVDSRMRFFYRTIGITKSYMRGIEYWNSYVVPNKVMRVFGLRAMLKCREWQLQRLVKRVINEHGKPDIVYSHYLQNSCISVTIKRKYNIPLVAIEHLSDLNRDEISSDLYYMGNKTYNNVDALLSVSNALKWRLKQYFNVDSIVVPNIVGDEFVYKKKSSSPVMSFVSVGSLIHRKGFDLLIKAFANADIPLKKWRLIIIGTGKERFNLKKDTKKCRLNENVLLVGQKSKSEIARIFQQSDIFVLASRAETFGVVYIEAMMMGLPVIGTKCGGPEEFVSSKNGIIVPTDDVSALTQAIEFLYYNRCMYDSDIISRECQNKYSPRIIARRLSDVFEQVIFQYKSL